MKNLFGFVTYPSTAGIIAVLWICSSILIIFDPTLPIIQMVVINMITSMFIGSLGFRVEK
jgi:hypothetical protein